MLPDWMAILLIAAALVGGFCYGHLWGMRYSADAFKRGYDKGHANGLEHYAMGMRPSETQEGKP